MNRDILGQSIEVCVWVDGWCSRIFKLVYLDRFVITYTEYNLLHVYLSLNYIFNKIVTTNLLLYKEHFSSRKLMINNISSFQSWFYARSDTKCTISKIGSSINIQTIEQNKKKQQQRYHKLLKILFKTKRRMI